MVFPPSSGLPEVFPTAQQEVARIASQAGVKWAVEWFRRQEPQLAQWQMELARIPGPPFGEEERSRWAEQRFRELGLEDVHRDELGNVFGRSEGFGQRCVAVSAHLDTVFPAGTKLEVKQQGSRLEGPGISDNAAGVTALLAMAAVMREAELQHGAPILFIANVGEEGEGDLRGMRHVFATPRWSESIASSLVVDGAGSDTVIAQALGSKRFEIEVRGPGGHSWSDYGVAHPVVALANAIQRLSQMALPQSPKTTFNVGTIQGGTSVNSIPQSATMRVDLRSASAEELDKLEGALRVAMEHCVEEEDERSERLGKRGGKLSAELRMIGDRPAGEVGEGARILQVMDAVDGHLGNVTRRQRASTDANIPIALGREAITIGGGGTGGGAHTLQEWFDCRGRELGLKRILLALLALAGSAE